MMRLLAEFYTTPSAVDPAVHAQMQVLLERWASGMRLSSEQISAAVGNAPQAAAERREQVRASGGGGVAILPVYGVLTHRAYAANSVSTPMTSTETLAAAVRSAVNNPDVGALVLDIDSPGGSVFGVQELGDTIYKLRNVKPIVAVANAQAASGAYWVASQATEIVVTPSGAVGSLGAFMAHTDNSAKYAADGVKKTYVYAGKYKVEGNDAGPLEGEGLVHAQSMVDSFYSAFVRSVARGRDVSVDAARGPNFGEGRMVLARQAVAHGMADRIAPLDDVVAGLLAKKPARPAAKALNATDANRRIAMLRASAPSVDGV